MNCGGTIYKGSQETLAFPIHATDISELEIKIFTDGEYEDVKTLSEVTIEDNTLYVPIEENDFDLLKDGVIRYSLVYVDEGDTYRSDVCTTYYLKTPLAYSAQTADDFYDEGYDDGYEQGYHDAEISAGTCVTTVGHYELGPDFSGYSGEMYPDEYWNAWEYFDVTDTGYGAAKFDSGYTKGVTEQKAKLSAVTIYQNGTVTREDGWSAVTVNIPREWYNTVVVSGTFVTNQDFEYTYSPWKFGIDTLYGGDIYTGMLKETTKVDGQPIYNVHSFIDAEGAYPMSAGTHTFVSEFTATPSYMAPSAITFNLPIQWVGFEKETSHNIKVFITPNQ